MTTFAQRLIDWQRRHGRRNLPWQRGVSPYRVWLSEIMLQQTQVATVIPYYERFLVRFPGLAELAAARVEDVMALWSGLGYYARARNLHKCAQTLMAGHAGNFPADPAELARLPGIGRSTANAIAVFCFGAHAPILDGNVRRLLCRHLGIEGYPGTATVESQLWRDAEALLPERDIATYIQAQMDIGAMLCTRGKPRCGTCPVTDDCVARNSGRVAELPAPRPRKHRPEREATLLVLRVGDRILLETRPPVGIWGGLLSLPELPAPHGDVAAYCRDRLGTTVTAIAPGPVLRHDFTHFRLNIVSLLCTAAPLAQACEPGLWWTAAADLADAALPAPVRRLLSAIP
ncbi:MAG: A/G-specific adenine glycosylase [Pseudomonadota bacterium]